MRVFICVLLVFIGSAFSDNRGNIKGEVRDTETHQPLVGANIIVIGTGLGAACDTEGRFVIANVPVGSYTVTASMVGYAAISRANVNIYSQRQTPLTFYLKQSSLKVRP